MELTPISCNRRRDTLESSGELQNISSFNKISSSLDNVSKGVDTENSQQSNLFPSLSLPNLDEDNIFKVNYIIASQDLKVGDGYLETLV